MPGAALGQPCRVLGLDIAPWAPGTRCGPFPALLFLCISFFPPPLQQSRAAGRCFPSLPLSLPGFVFNQLALLRKPRPPPSHLLRSFEMRRAHAGSGAPCSAAPWALGPHGLRVPTVLGHGCGGEAAAGSTQSPAPLLNLTRLQPPIISRGKAKREAMPCPELSAACRFPAPSDPAMGTALVPLSLLAGRREHRLTPCMDPWAQGTQQQHRGSPSSSLHLRAAF